ILGGSQAMAPYPNLVASFARIAQTRAALGHCRRVRRTRASLNDTRAPNSDRARGFFRTTLNIPRVNRAQTIPSLGGLPRANTCRATARVPRLPTRRSVPPDSNSRLDTARERGGTNPVRYHRARRRRVQAAARIRPHQSIHPRPRASRTLYLRAR